VLIVGLKILSIKVTQGKQKVQNVGSEDSRRQHHHREKCSEVLTQEERNCQQDDRSKKEAIKGGGREEKSAHRDGAETQRRETKLYKTKSSKKVPDKRSRSNRGGLKEFSAPYHEKVSAHWKKEPRERRRPMLGSGIN